ncbi:arsenate-mycothiol transferase ArsC [Gordonia sp. FQ]|uniref:arsenate-mycothiol transferase ArsC n=1 Tax=Gordonia sp. FQ TaxID=3446634 RepID=UPI003F87ABA4
MPNSPTPSESTPKAGTRPSVLFVCVKNAGKSQMAAALMRQAAEGMVTVHSAGTRPGNEVNSLSAQSLAEIGIDITSQTPKPIDPGLLSLVDMVITLGREALVDPPTGVRVVNWDTDEPSERGIDGIERMRMVRDDIAARVTALAAELTTPAAKAGSRLEATARPTNATTEPDH